VDGLTDRPKRGRPSEIPNEVSYRIRNNLKESKQGWTRKQVSDIILRESGKSYHYTHIYRILHRWGFKLKVPRKVHVSTSKEENVRNYLIGSVS
jgi:transposase